MDTKKLRQKILDLAIHGKLVPQDPNDEPASVLLERIRVEKEQLIKEGKIKAPKKSKTAGDTSHYGKEEPWELPEGWCWSTIGDIFLHNTGKALNASDKEGKKLTYITTSNLYWDRFELSTLKEMPFTKSEIEKCTASKGDLLVCEGGDIGRAAIWQYDYDIRIQNHIHRLRGLGEVNHRLFLFWFMYLKTTGLIGGKGIGLMGLSSGELDKLEIPVPPLREQGSIVRKIDNLFIAIQKLDEECSLLMTNIEQTKSKILDLAIHGKLMPQDPADEPAFKFLRRINPEFKPSDNLHYEGSIPSGWQIVRMGDVIDIVSGTSYQKTDIVSAGTGIRVLRGGNIQDGNILICEDDVFIDSSLANKGNTIGRGDTVIVASTGSSELIGKAAFVTKDYPGTQIGAFLRIIRPKSICFSEYLGLIFQTEYYKHHIKQVAKGTNINNIKSSYITEFVIPLPPLEEQRRIQCQLKRLLSIIDQITDFINGSE